MATYGVIGSPTYAVAINNLGGMLNVLPDNSSNLISAQDVRDVVAGLFENVQGVSASVATIASASVTYTNLNLTSVSVGGIGFNSNFTGSSIQNVFDRLFYPYTAPSLTLSVSPNLIEYGNTSQTVALSWELGAGINDIQSANLERPLQSPQSVSTPLAFGYASGTLGSNNVVGNTLTVFTFSVNDLNTSVSPNTGGDNFLTASVSWSLRRYWGTLSSGDLITVTSSTFSHSDVSTLNSELFEGYTQSRQIMTNNDYVVFVWPTNSVNLESMPPKVSINGLANNDWTKTRNGVVFTNQYGYTASYDVWRFNNIQGTFTSSYVITT